MNESDLADFIETAKTKQLSKHSWVVDVETINTDTWDLTVNNPNTIQEIDTRTPQEIIEIKHTAKTRDIFVDGTIDAVKWISKKRSGLYNMYDVLKIRDQ